MSDVNHHLHSDVDSHANSHANRQADSDARWPDSHPYPRPDSPPLLSQVIDGTLSAQPGLSQAPETYLRLDSLTKWNCS